MQTPVATKTLEAVMLTGLTRLRNTPSGNPRYMVHTNVGSFRTEDDSQVASSLSEAMVFKTFDLTLDSRSKVRGLVEVPSK